MISIPKIVNRMSHLKHFKGMSITDIGVIVRSGHIQKYREGAVVVMEDESCAGLFVLLSGEIHLYKLGPDGQEILLHVVTPVMMFNEIAILDGGPNLLTAMAAKDCLVWHADYGSLLTLSERYPQVALGFLPVIAKRHRALLSMVANVCFRSVRARTAKLLLDLSDYGERPIARQEHTINQMSAQISTVPEAISRSIGLFRDKGYIVSSRSTITVCRPEELAALAQIESNPKAS